MVVSKAPSARTFLCIAVALVAVLSIATKQVSGYTDLPDTCNELNKFCDDPEDDTVAVMEICIDPDDEQANKSSFYKGLYSKYIISKATKSGQLPSACQSGTFDYKKIRRCLQLVSSATTLNSKLGGCGCPNPEASNYNPEAIAEYPGYCKFPKKGCTLEGAINYDPEAVVDDESCEFPKKGCTDESATNYDPEAVVDDGTCTFPKKGCTDESATNYDPLAVDDDGTCTFPRIAEVHGGTHANATGHIQSIGGNAVSTLLDGLSAATTIAESASAIIGGSGPSAKANVAAHTRGANTYRLGTAARTRSTTHQNKMHYGTLGTSNTHFDGYAYGKKKDDESTEGAHGADVSLVSPHFSGGYASVGSGYGKDYHAYAGQKESLRATGYKLPYSIPVEAITNQYYHHYSGR